MHQAREPMHLRMRARPREVATARHAVTDFLSSSGVPAPIVDDLELVTSELVTNAVLHPEPSPHPIKVSVESDHRAVSIEVANYGGIAPIPAVPNWRVAAPNALSGRGLGIVRQLCDEVEVRQDGEWAVVVCRRHLLDRGDGP